MQNNILELQKEFERIKNMGWIKEKRKGFCSVGYTFEKMLGKDEDDFPISDYKNIEIKTRNSHSKNNLHLFSLTPDGDYLYSIKRLLHTLGFISKKHGNERVFFSSFNGKEFTKLFYGQQGKLKVNYQKQKVELVILNNRGEDINIGVSWSFSLLKERINLKLKYLAVINASSRIINNQGYYYYNRIIFYQLKDFDTFLNLIENGYIIVTFKIDVYKSGRRTGQVHDHGTDFSIKIDNINLLYNEIKL